MHTNAGPVRAMTPYRRIFGSGPWMLFFSILLPLLALLVQRITELPRPDMGLALRWLGAIASLALGGGFMLWSLRELPPARRGLHLVTTGPFRYLRHPLYGGMLFTAGSISFFLGSSYLVLPAWALLYLVAHRLVIPEEQMLEEKFGEEWRRYARNVPRFVPRIRRRIRPRPRADA